MNLFELFATLGLDSSEYDKGLDEASKSANSFGSKIASGFGAAAKVGAAALTAASGAAVAFGKSAVSAGMSFDTSMAQVAATMGKTIDELNSDIQTVETSTGTFTGTLREFAQYLGSSTSFSASQSADALNYMALAGYDAKTSMEMLPTVLNLAAAGGIDLAYASDMVTDASSALGLSIDETKELIDKMATASSKSNTSVAQLGEAILTVGGTAKTLSGGTTELSTALGILADNGVKGAEGGTLLRNVILSLSAPAKEAGEFIDKLGLEAFDAEGNMRPLNEVFGDLSGILSDMTQGERTKTLSNIFNKTDLKGVTALLAAAGDEVASISVALDNAEISWDKYADAAWMANDGIDDLADQIRYMIEDLGESAEEMQDFLHFEYDLDEEDAIIAIKAVEEAMASFGNRFDELSGYIDNAADSASAMADTQLDTLAGDITIFQSALEGAQIVLSDQLTPTLREFVKLGSDGISAITDGFKEGGLSGAMEAFGSVLSDALGVVVEKAPLVIDAGMKLLEALGQGIVDNIDIITNSAVDVIIQLVYGIGENLPKLVSAGLQIIKSLAKGIAKNIKTITKAVVDVILEIAKALTDPEMLTDIVEAGLDIIEGLIEGLIEALPQLIETLPIIIQNISDFLTGPALPDIIETGVTLFAALVEALPDIIAAIAAALPDIINGVIKALFDPKILHDLVNAGVKMFKALVQNLPDIILAIVEAIPDIIEGITDALLDPNTLLSLIQAGIELFVAIVSDIPTIVMEIGKKIPELVEGIASAIGDCVGTIIDAGANLIMGLWEGIKSMGQWLKDKVSGFFGGIVDGIKGFFGIASPSKLFRDEIGTNLALGIGIGFADEFSSVKNDIENALDFASNGEYAATMSLTTNANGTSANTTSQGVFASAAAEKQPLIVILQLPSGVEVGRQYIEDINLAKRVDGLAY